MRKAVDLVHLNEREMWVRLDTVPEGLRNKGHLTLALLKAQWHWLASDLALFDAILGSCWIPLGLCTLESHPTRSYIPFLQSKAHIRYLRK